MKDKKSPAQYNLSSAIIAWLCVAGSIATAIIIYFNEGRLPTFASILVIIALIVLAVAATISAWRTRNDKTPREYEIDPTHPDAIFGKVYVTPSEDDKENSDSE
ncbi:MAG: hypothetical protein IJA85_00260 [Clostridia bacterium]|nr:hypothetical protein [Clostridia bacterium]